MAIVLRFVDKYGFIKERFFDIVHVLDTTSATLKEKICILLSHHNLSAQNIRGQGYDGASNMFEEWTGLQALFCAECPFAYYVHCFSHRLQLALVGASKQVISINQFFSYLTRAINIVGSSYKRHDQLRAAQAANIAEKLAIDDEFEAILRIIINDGSKLNQRAEADGIYDSIHLLIDSQLQELNNKFKEDVMELLVLSSALDPRDGYRSYNDPVLPRPVLCSGFGFRDCILLSMSL
ncbi:zinc finger MYM-type protein 1-like [Camellia sinensis]|uniref:zinc finger MYM-type protein 1-like n=1 Tax=Camellia sinensis TaxID=4442 RepID=UPI001036EE3F|nr:zinc finger MYM-type protein 1-like [Camellia sinensis]